MKIPGLLLLLLTIGSTAVHARQESKDTLTEAASDPAFQAKHPLKDKPDAAPQGEIIHLAGEDQAYLAHPGKEAKAAILIFHEWWGLNDFVKAEADKLAHEGYLALAVDLYGGQAATTPDQAKSLMQAVDEKKARALVESAFGYLKNAKIESIGTLGWCFGGTWSLRAAIQGGKGVKACVVYYGELVSDPKLLEPLAAPVLAHVPKKDAWITPEMGAKFEKAMKELGKSVQVELYDADHAFANPSNPKHEPGEAQRASTTTMQFLRTHLLPP